MKVGEHRQLNDPDRLMNEIAELNENLRHRLTLDCLNIKESYKNGDLNVVVSVNVGGYDFIYVWAVIPAGCFPLSDCSFNSSESVTHIYQVGMLSTTLRSWRTLKSAPFPP